MKLKYNIEIEDKIISQRLQNLINQIYKLLPSREEGVDWEKPLETIIEELAGLERLMDGGYPEIFLPLLCKLEGLFLLTNVEDFSWYRRTIFECLGLMNELKKKLCP